MPVEAVDSVDGVIYLRRLYTNDFPLVIVLPKIIWATWIFSTTKICIYLFYFGVLYGILYTKSCFVMVPDGTHKKVP